MFQKFLQPHVEAIQSKSELYKKKDITFSVNYLTFVWNTGSTKGSDFYVGEVSNGIDDMMAKNQVKEKILVILVMRMMMINPKM